MKIYLMSVLSIFILCLQAAAVDQVVKTSGQTKYGLKVGVGITDLTGDVRDKYLEPASKSGFTGGGFALIKLNSLIYIQPEILYVEKGAKAKDILRADRLNLTYLDIPILLKFVVPLKSAFKPNIFFGPAPSILLKAEYDLGSIQEDVSENIMNIDFRLEFGTGLDIKLDRGLIMLDVRYTQGVIAIDDTHDKLNIKNKALLFMMGFAF